MTRRITIQASTTSPRNKPKTASGRSSSSNDAPENLLGATSTEQKIKNRNRHAKNKQPQNNARLL
ncbi:MAG TPA: hypothetical protein DCQ92_06600 [Verrucomicrobia subdivision 3 bacterium]|nr:hypothetical protein [Limisphaerales bacterium]